MTLSINSNVSSMAALNAYQNSTLQLITSMHRLNTGKRINSASDDAAGLQIATRLQSQSNGMGVARRNISDATALLQVADSSFEQISEILLRIKDIATAAASDSYTQDDRKVMQQEVNQNSQQAYKILIDTEFSGEKLFSWYAKGAFDPESEGKLYTRHGINFQIGSDAKEVMNFSLFWEINAFYFEFSDLLYTTDKPLARENVSTQAAANRLIQVADVIQEKALDVRTKIGSSLNRLEHTKNNLGTMQDSTDLALGNIQDTDFAQEASNMTRSQMLSKTGVSMLRQSNQMSGMILGLLS